MCTPVFESSNLLDSTGECDDILKKPNRMAIFLKDGGENLIHVMRRVVASDFNQVHRAVFRALQNLFVGLDHLHDNDFVHLDIKSSNVVCKLVSGEEKRFFGFYIGRPTYIMKFIDFGISNKTADAMPTTEMFDYFFWPFDLRFVKESYLDETEVLDAVDLLWYYHQIREPVENFAPYWLIRNTPATPQIDFYMGIQEYIKSLNAEGKKEVRRDILKKTDIYGLGLVLADCYYNLTKIRKSGENTYEDDSKTGKNKKFIVGGTQHTAVTVPLYNLVDKMTHPDFRQRITAKDARVEYERLLLSIEAYFEAEK
jgi:serine/threonine protein kinase